MLAPWLSILLGSASLAWSSVLPRAEATTAIATGYGLYGTYIVPDTKISFSIHSKGFKGVAHKVELDPSDMDFHWFNASFTPMPRSALERRNAEVSACQYGAVCKDGWADTPNSAGQFIHHASQDTCTAVYNAMLAFWTNDDYAMLLGVMQGAVSYQSIAFVQTGLGDTIWNTRATMTGGSDSLCNLNANKVSTAFYFAASQYNFCMAVGRDQELEASTTFVFGEFEEQQRSHGNIGILSNFVAGEAGNFGPTCPEIDVQW